MTNEELAAIKARAEAATPGPWVISGDLTVYSAAESVTTMEWASDDTDDTDLPPYPLEQHEADAAFIAHAREDIPALLGERAALLAIVAQVQASNDVHGEGAKCHFCGWTPAVAGSHAPECQREQARAFLAAEAAQE